MKNGQMKQVEEPPPFGGSWIRIYRGVIIYLCFLIGLLYWFSSVWNR